jgi:hypothetical protein
MKVGDLIYNPRTKLRGIIFKEYVIPTSPTSSLYVRWDDGRVGILGYYSLRDIEVISSS